MIKKYKNNWKKAARLEIENIKSGYTKKTKPERQIRFLRIIFI